MHRVVGSVVCPHHPLDRARRVVGVSPHRIEMILGKIESEHRLARRRQFIVYALFFLAVLGLAFLYTQVRDLSQENQHRLAENRAAVIQINRSRQINNVCPDLQSVKRILRKSVREQYAELKKPGTLAVYQKVYGAARGKRLYTKALQDLPLYLAQLEPQRCSTPEGVGR